MINIPHTKNILHYCTEHQEGTFSPNFLYDKGTFLTQSDLNMQSNVFYIKKCTSCKLQKAYTSLGPSCHNAYTKFQLLLAHAHIHFNCNWTQCVCIVAYCNGNAYMHEHATIEIWCTHCGRKDLNWCMPFGVYSQ